MTDPLLSVTFNHDANGAGLDGAHRVDLAGAARRAASYMVKMRARSYARRPLGLEALYPGLSSADATTLIAVASHLVDQACRAPRRWFGFGGEVGVINARAALLLGRAKRRSRDVPVSSPKLRHGSPSDGGNQNRPLLF